MTSLLRPEQVADRLQVPRESVLALVLRAWVIAILFTACATPRSAPVIPAESYATRTIEPDQGRTGAPLERDSRDSADTRRATTRLPATTSGAPLRSPTAVHDPTPSATLHGIASWYDNGGGIYGAAGPALRTGNWRGRLVTVCADSCVAVRLTDWCACPQRLIDLSRDAFSRLAPLSRGLVRVTISATGPAATLPPTDR